MLEMDNDGLPHSVMLDDKSSFERIYRQYWSGLYIYSFNVLRERELCEDIVQEVFTDLWERKHDVQILDLKCYLYQSVKYQIFNHFRKSKYRKELLAEFAMITAEPGPADANEMQELKTQMKEVVSKLPERRRIIFEMSRNEGLSNKEIAESLDISPQTVKNQLSVALEFIRKSLGSFYSFFF